MAYACFLNDGIQSHQQAGFNPFASLNIKFSQQGRQKTEQPLKFSEKYLKTAIALPPGCADFCTLIRTLYEQSGFSSPLSTDLNGYHADGLPAN